MGRLMTALYRIDTDKYIELLHELELEKGEDAPMSMAAHPSERSFACGVNSSVEALQTGENQNCRIFGVEDKRLALSKSQSTLSINELEDDFQKVTAFSPSGDLLAAAGTKDLSLLYYPSLAPAAAPVHLDKGEIYDASFSSNTLVVATTVSLLVYALPPSEAKGRVRRLPGRRKRTLCKRCSYEAVERPTLPGNNAGSSFRSVPPQDGKDKNESSPRRAFVCKWDTEKWEVTKMRKVGDKGVTCFDVSPNGKLVAFGSSDYTVGILDAKTLAPLITILKAHDFPPTTLRLIPRPISSSLEVRTTPSVSSLCLKPRCHLLDFLGHRHSYLARAAVCVHRSIDARGLMIIVQSHFLPRYIVASS
ncbi:uncharacterized protein B0H18DRAFT_1205723 [Fomitopsis serialis]|uniref:uncharacterized protein n=1 Tax=Fomitopsis serialis TaxID=139415 RepID=UPI002007FFE3|nr:uncharacterized protein B0H18DRAFT_1205723 [Neoantrodia serialis]KAH9938495.1 hypothetical protein B0H18DRAFT_1205723 [Neoantrodia serialis]